MNDLALQVAQVHDVEIDEGDLARSRGGEIHRDGSAQAAHADDAGMGGEQGGLGGFAESFQLQMATVPGFLVRSHGSMNSGISKRVLGRWLAVKLLRNVSVSARV